MQMFAEKQERYPKGTYKLLLMMRPDHSGAVYSFHLVNLATGRRILSGMVWDIVRFIEDDIAASQYPECSIQYRTWNAEAHAFRKKAGVADVFGNSRAGDGKEAVVSSFIIRIMFRQNATWQGSIQWMEGMQTRQYRSVNELLSLVGEAADLNAGRAKSASREA